MHFDQLATELVILIFSSCATVSDALTLSAVSHRYRAVFNAQKLAVLASTAETQYGPLHDATQLVTYNDSQAVHVPRNVPLSQALLRQVIEVGKVAEKWCDLFPHKRWKVDFESRRVLLDAERFRCRRAIYRIWLFGLAFHNRANSRSAHPFKPGERERSMLLHNWSNQELVEMTDVRRVIRSVLSENVCPSNSTVARRWKKRFPDTGSSATPLMFNIHLNYPPATRESVALESGSFRGQPGMDHSDFYQHRPPQCRTSYAWTRYNATPSYNPGTEAWGEDSAHYDIVEDMLKLSPKEILYLREHCRFKAEVLSCVAHFASGGKLHASTMSVMSLLGGDDRSPRAIARDSEWFNHNGETFMATCATVLEERGYDLWEMLREHCTGWGGLWGVVHDEYS